MFVETIKKNIVYELQMEERILAWPRNHRVIRAGILLIRGTLMYFVFLKVFP